MLDRCPGVPPERQRNGTAAAFRDEYTSTPTTKPASEAHKSASDDIMLRKAHAYKSPAKPVRTATRIFVGS